MKPDAYFSSDYCGVSFGDIAFYYGYEVSMCATCGEIAKPGNEYCDKEGHEDRYWCFKAHVNGYEENIPFPELGCEDMFNLGDCLLSGIAKFLSKCEIKPPKSKTSATEEQKGAWFVLMGQVAAWMKSKNITEEVYISVNGKPQKVATKEPSTDFAHELTMYKLFPVKPNGKRMSLTTVLKDKWLMCDTLDKVFQYYADRGCILTLTTDVFGYHEYKELQEQ